MVKCGQISRYWLEIFVNHSASICVNILLCTADTLGESHVSILELLADQWSACGPLVRNAAATAAIRAFRFPLSDRKSLCCALLPRIQIHS